MPGREGTSKQRFTDPLCAPGRGVVSFMALYERADHSVRCWISLEVRVALNETGYMGKKDELVNSDRTAG